MNLAPLILLVLLLTPSFVCPSGRRSQKPKQIMVIKPQNYASNPPQNYLPKPNELAVGANLLYHTTAILLLDNKDDLTRYKKEKLLPSNSPFQDLVEGKTVDCSLDASKLSDECLVYLFHSLEKKIDFNNQACFETLQRLVTECPNNNVEFFLADSKLPDQQTVNLKTIIEMRQLEQTSKELVREQAIHTATAAVILNNYPFLRTQKFPLSSTISIALETYQNNQNHEQLFASCLAVLKKYYASQSTSPHALVNTEPILRKYALELDSENRQKFIDSIENGKKAFTELKKTGALLQIEKKEEAQQSWAVEISPNNNRKQAPSKQNKKKKQQQSTAGNTSIVEKKSEHTVINSSAESPASLPTPLSEQNNEPTKKLHKRLTRFYPNKAIENVFCNPDVYATFTKNGTKYTILRCSEKESQKYTIQYDPRVSRWRTNAENTVKDLQIPLAKRKEAIAFHRAPLFLLASFFACWSFPGTYTDKNNRAIDLLNHVYKKQKKDSTLSCHHVISAFLPKSSANDSSICYHQNNLNIKDFNELLAAKNTIPEKVREQIEAAFVSLQALENSSEQVD